MGRLSPLLQWAFLRLLNIVMQNFKIYTLIDITETGKNAFSTGTDLEKKQQQNFMTLMQTIGLRANPSYESRPKVIDDFEVKSLPFGKKFKSKQRVWEWEFFIESDSEFKDDSGNDIGLLVRDLHLIPIITDLTETAKLNTAVFDTSDPEVRNTIILLKDDK
jgi:hypothetical protein